MNDVEQTIQLVEDTLNETRVIRLGDSCLVGNGAAEELKRLGPVALPVIQQVVVRRVVPIPQEVADHHELMWRFPGLLSLWVTYFRLAQHTHLQEAVDFLGTLDGSVLASAVLGCTSVWGSTNWDELPPTLATLLQEIATHPSDIAAEVVRQRLLHVWNRHV
ncbi:hypothetical protein [Tuwongella immobilis]|uniref:Uncharacterized protein n=1 Tax=Tuwongella immobilis TaxID=692036 RepID=A0A6C2YH42_9BACT|nr:hypothetical protein [Tuwongella immobilis]VIP00806.1 unnamed protein product [Tuwongella immobilis]VTR97030.1 unnamed protein product [Tuwongella immobilis]